MNSIGTLSRGQNLRLLRERTKYKIITALRAAESPLTIHGIAENLGLSRFSLTSAISDLVKSGAVKAQFDSGMNLNVYSARK